MKRILVLVALFGCTPKSRRYTQHHLNNMAFGLAVGATACDWGQTRRAASMDWNGGRWSETNPILGDHPSTTKIDIYMATALVGLVVSKKVLPEWAQSFLYAGAIAFEADSLIATGSIGIPMCGLQAAEASE